MSSKNNKTFKRERAFDEKSGHHFRQAKRTQEVKQQKKLERSLRHYNGEEGTSLALDDNEYDYFDSE